jgi:hypothetical protein
LRPRQAATAGSLHYSIFVVEGAVKTPVFSEQQ